MSDFLFLDSRRSLAVCVIGAMLALIVVRWMPSPVVLAAGPSIFDNDQPPDSTEKPGEGKKPAPRPINTPAPQPAEPIPPAPATSPAPALPSGESPGISALPVPSAAAINRSAKLLKELFAGELADHTTAGRLALIGTMLKYVDKNAEDPSAQYVLLTQVRDLAASAGDVATAAQADSELSERFRQSPRSALMTRLTALSSAVAARSRGGRWPAEEASTAMAALGESADASMRLGDMASADKFTALVETVAKACGDPVLLESARARAARQSVLREESTAVVLAQATLSSNPTDPPSNLAVGRYLCDVKLDWQRGLPLLTRGSDGSLKQLAEREMTPPSDAVEQESLGTAWWDAADCSPPAQQDWLRRRAIYWYMRSAPALDGLTRVRAQNRLAQHRDLLAGEFGSPADGARIAKAAYGAGNQCGDVTEIIQKALDQDPFMPIVANNSICGDPAPFVHKSIKINYVWRGKHASMEVSEEEAGAVPNLPETGVVLPGASGKFKIIAMRWGWGKECRDVTAILKPALLDPTQPFSPPAGSLDPDPADGIHKWMAIWFEDHGRRYVRLCRDDRFPITLFPAN